MRCSMLRCLPPSSRICPPDAQNYVAQLARVLKPGARALCTFFLLNDESKPLIEAKKGVLNFGYQEGIERSARTRRRWASLTKKASSRSVREAWLGSARPDSLRVWCGRTQHLSMQDILLVTKTARVLSTHLVRRVEGAAYAALFRTDSC
jgi:hypothetical protein